MRKLFETLLLQFKLCKSKCLIFLNTIGNTVFSFNGNGGRDTVDLRTTLSCVQGNNPRSMSFMLKTTFQKKNFSYVFSTGTNSGFNEFSFLFESDFIHVSVANAYLTSNAVLTDGLWHSILIAYDGTILSIYKDGIFLSSHTYWNAGPTAPLSSIVNTVGNNNNYLGSNGAYSYWPGSLKNVNFYNYKVSNAYVLMNSYQVAGSNIYDSGKILSYLHIFFNIHIHYNF